MKLSLDSETLAICQLRSDAPVPDWLPAQGFTSVTRSEDELSIVCGQRHIPAGVNAEPGWCALQVAGPLEFSAVGILAEVSRVLAAAGISIFVVSTFDTDYVLVKEQGRQRALDALRAAGHEVGERDAML